MRTSPLRLSFVSYTISCQVNKQQIEIVTHRISKTNETGNNVA